MPHRPIEAATGPLPENQAAIFAASRRRLLSIAHRMLNNRAEAEDLVQETWLRWHHAEREALRTPVAWLTTVVTRLAIDRLRELQREREQPVAGPWLPEPGSDPVAPSPETLLAEQFDLNYGLGLMFNGLSPEEHAALLLYEAFDCSHAEIAGILSKEVAACRQIVHRAKQRVQRLHADMTRALAPRPVIHPVSDAIRQMTRPAPQLGEDESDLRASVQRICDAIAAQDKAAVVDLLLGREPVVADIADAQASLDDATNAHVTMLQAQPREALTENTGSFAITTTHAEAQRLAAHWTRWVKAGGTIEAMSLEGRPGLAFMEGCKIVFAIGFSLHLRRLVCCELVYESAALGVLNERCDPLDAMRRVRSFRATAGQAFELCV